jgi:hypothetical protein
MSLGRKIEYVTGKTRDDYQPHVEVADKQTGMSWDGVVYYGTGTVDGRRVYYKWGDDVETGRGPFERFEMEKLGDRKDYVGVEQDIEGFHVFSVYLQTPEQLALLDRNREIDRSHPHVPGDNRGALDTEAWRTRQEIVKREQKEAGCSWEDIREANGTFPPENFLGHFFVDGLEFEIQHYWSGYREDLLKEPQEVQDFVNGAPLMSDGGLPAPPPSEEAVGHGPPASKIG